MIKQKPQEAGQMRRFLLVTILSILFAVSCDDVTACETLSAPAGHILAMRKPLRCSSWCNRPAMSAHLRLLAQASEASLGSSLLVASAMATVNALQPSKLCERAQGSCFPLEPLEESPQRYQVGIPSRFKAWHFDGEQLNSSGEEMCDVVSSAYDENNQETEYLAISKCHRLIGSIKDSPNNSVIVANIEYSLQSETHPNYVVLSAKNVNIDIQNAATLQGHLASGKLITAGISKFVTASARVLKSSEAVQAMTSISKLNEAKRSSQVHLSRETLSIEKKPYTYSIKLLGSGASGDVYNVDFTKVGGLVPEFSIAVKRESLNNPFLFLNEVVNTEGLAVLPNAMQFYGAIKVAGPVDTYYMAIEKLEGDWLHARESFSEEQITDLMIGGCDAIAAIEAAGYVHHDVKPANFLYDKTGTTRIADLAGLSKRQDTMSINAIFDSPGTYFPFEASLLFSRTKTKDIVYDSSRVDRFALGLAMIEMRLKAGVYLSDLIERSDCLFVPALAVEIANIVDGDKLTKYLQSHQDLFSNYHEDEMNLYYRMIGNNHAERPAAENAAHLLRKSYGRTLIYPQL